MPQLEHIEAIEKRLWSAADTLRANSKYASNQYFLPVMGLIFLRHAYSRYLMVKESIVPTLPKRNGKPRAMTKEDFSQKNAIFLREKAQFDYLVRLPDGVDRVAAVKAAMESIENDYDSLRGALPKDEYNQLDNNVLGSLLRTLNPEELQQVSGDVFGRIYEYFLTAFADDNAHDGGEFFTPVSLVSLIAHVLDPKGGTVLDPACGSGGMFVQSARTVEEHGKKPSKVLHFCGLEKNETTIRLAKMNLAVHGLEGNIKQAITYYEDPHELQGKADYVMANPPFNVDEIDAEKISNDPRLPFGLPGVNQSSKVVNGNYIWVSYFYSYLSKQGRAGFVMSSQASRAGGGEGEVRRQLIESGDVELMIAIRSNFFYTRAVPCELWFLNRAKPAKQRDKVLMIDARNISRQVTRRVYDFTPEQEKNILAIVHLYRGESERFAQLVSGYLRQVVEEGMACYEWDGEDGATYHLLSDYDKAIASLADKLKHSADKLPDKTLSEFNATWQAIKKQAKQFQHAIARAKTQWEETADTGAELTRLTKDFAPLAQTARSLMRQADHLYTLAAQLADACGSTAGNGIARGSGDIMRAHTAAYNARQEVIEQIKLVNYYWQQAHWLTERFPHAELRDVEGLVKLVSRAEIAASDWSLTPERYVGIAVRQKEEEVDYPQMMREIHTELEDINGKVAELAEVIHKSFGG